MNPWPPHVYFARCLQLGRTESQLLEALYQARTAAPQDIPPILTLRHLSVAVDVSYRLLRQVVSRRLDPYRVFFVRKRSGNGQRQICIPHPLLMTTQRWIAKHVLAVIKPSHNSFAYSPGSSIAQCASVHCCAKWLIKIDIRRFFESVSEIQAYRVYHQLAGFEPLVSFELARLSTRLFKHSARYDHTAWLSRYVKVAIGEYLNPKIGHLPQGAPTSPMLANLAMVGFDEIAKRIARKYGLEFTRYSDDLAFSTSVRDFTRDRARSFVREIYHLMPYFGLAPNTAKTVIVPPGARKVVLGLLVDTDRPRLSREFRSSLELHVFHLRKHGPASHAEKRGFESILGLRRHIDGLLSHACQIDPEYAATIRIALAAVSWPL